MADTYNDEIMEKADCAGATLSRKHESRAKKGIRRTTSRYRDNTITDQNKARRKGRQGSRIIGWLTPL